MENEQSFQQLMWNNWIQMCKKKIISCIICKPNSKQIIDLTVEPKAIKLLENIGEDLCYLGLGKDFSDVTPKA